LIDENGQVAGGDQLMALLAGRWMEEQRLIQGTLVATIMSNLGLERFMQARGGDLARTKVGDRYVVEEMRAKGLNLGGEQSGHIVMTDYATTGDGLMAGLQFLAEMVQSGQRASTLATQFEKVPQLLKNVRYQEGQVPLEDAGVTQAIAAAEAQLAGNGRLVIRKSGTEPLIRVMAESEDETILTHAVDHVVTAVEAATA
jgi:phosphoglucosamine mutase